jgi:hypothetical protein
VFGARKTLELGRRIDGRVLGLNHSGGWRVCFDFASRGELELTYDELQLLRAPALLTPSGL